MLAPGSQSSPFPTLITVHDAVTDSPIYRTNVVHWDEQLDLFEKWLSALSTHMKHYIEKLNSMSIQHPPFQCSTQLRLFQGSTRTPWSSVTRLDLLLIWMVGLLVCLSVMLSYEPCMLIIPFKLALPLTGTAFNRLTMTLQSTIACQTKLASQHYTCPEILSAY